ARISLSASSLSDQYRFCLSAVSRSGSFACETATALFVFPFGVNPTARIPPSARPRRIDLGAVAVRTLTVVPFSQRSRTDLLDQASNNVVTGTSNVRDLVAS